MERTILKANDGKVLTDGKIYGKIIYLAQGMDADSFYEISDEEYLEVVRQEDEKNEAQTV